MRKIVAADLRIDSNNSTSVVSDAQKFILPVPPFGVAGEPLVYPKDHVKAGQPILDYQQKPVGDRGLVFFNAKDRSWQAAPGDGSAVIIINEVTREQAEGLSQKIRSFQEDPNQLTLEQLKETLAFARDELNLGDMYNSTRDFVKEKMSPIGEAPLVDESAREAFGLKKRDDRDICQAVFIPGRFIFEGPAATPQVFEDGGVIVAQGGELRGVQPDAFMRTYRLADGRPISSISTDLKIMDEIKTTEP